MPIAHPDVREFLRTTVGLGAQVAEGTALTTIPTWLWADVFNHGRRPQMDIFNGAFGGAHYPRDANILTNDLEQVSFRFGATETLLTLILPWVTQAAFSGTAIPYTALDINNFFTVAFQDHPGGRDLRLVDAVPSEILLESNIADKGILMGTVAALGQSYEDDAAGTLTFSQASPTDTDTYRHNALVTTIDGATALGVSRVSLRLPTGVFQWPHNSREPLLRKDGALNITGEIESAFSDSTDTLRRNANTETFSTISFAWPNSVSGTFTITLSDVILTDPIDTGFADARYIPFRGVLTNFGTPSLTLTT